MHTKPAKIAMAILAAGMLMGTAAMADMHKDKGMMSDKDHSMEHKMQHHDGMKSEHGMKHGESMDHKMMSDDKMDKMDKMDKKHY